MSESNMSATTGTGGSIVQVPESNALSREVRAPSRSTQPANDSSTILSTNEAVDTTKDLVLHEMSLVLHRPIDHLDISRSFVRHGGDSIAAVQVQQACQKMGIKLSIGTILGSERLSDVVRECQTRGFGHWSTDSPGSELKSRSPLPNHSVGAGHMADVGVPKKKEDLTWAESGRNKPTSVSWQEGATGSHRPRTRSDGSFVLVDGGVPAAAKADGGGGDVVTEMQTTLIEGSRQNPGTNIICLHDQCATQMVPTLKAAWNKVLSSEPIFNTTFCGMLSNRLERRGTEATTRTPGIEWAEITTYDQDAFHHEVRRRPACFGKDLGIGCSFKVVTLRKGSRRPSTSTVIWNVHHALVDGYSARLLYHKVLRVINHQEHHPRPGTSFFNVSPSIRFLQNKSRGPSKEFWKGLADKHPAAVGKLCLPSPIPSSPKLGGRLDEIGTVRVSMGGLVDPVSTPSRCGVSVAALYHAAWALVLSLYLDSDQVVFGTVLSGRSLPLPGVGDAIGPLINTLPLFVNIDPDLSTSEFLHLVFRQMLDLDSVQFSIPQDGYSRDFSTALAEELEFPASPFSGGVSPTFDMTSEIPLRVLFNHSSGFRICYDPQTYRASHIRGIAECLKKAVLCLLAPGRLDMCVAQLVTFEMREMLRDMGNCFSEDTMWGSVQHDLVTLFEKAVDFDPRPVALEQDGRCLTYQELDDLSGHVASLLSLEIEVGDTVCVSADGSINWIVAIYGILKAGGVYGALSHRLPPEVLDDSFKTSGATVFLAPYAKEKSLKPASCSTCFSIEDMLAGGFHSPWNHRAQPIPWADAYICFTSGSTGKPKGVICTHAGLVAFQRDQEVRLHANPGTRVSQLMSPAFDGSIHEIFSALSYGATLVLAPSCGDISHLHSVDSILSTPSMVKELSPDEFPRLKQLYMVGENVPQNVNDVWADSDTGVKVYNMYGPTEATCGATIKRLTANQKVNIGGPNPSSRLYVLDRRGRLIPPGVVGEIHIAGVQVSRGYIGRPEETDTWFKLDHVCPHPGEMMYKTGDRGFWNSYGEIELLGRTDRQIKLRGFRMDLNDLEIRMERLVSPDGAVAVTRKDDYLVAMVQRQDTDLDVLRARVAEVMPPHCIPKYYVAVDKIPLTPVGKIDYKAVAAAVVPKTPPRSPVTLLPEKQEYDMMIRVVAGVWRDILELGQEVSLDEDSKFVALGGFSLRQIMVANRLSQLLGVKVTHAQVMGATSLGDLARTLEEMNISLPAPLSTLALESTSTVPLKGAPCTNIPSGELAPIEIDWWKKYQANSGTSAFNVNFVCELDGTIVDSDTLAEAWNIVLARHQILRCRYKQDYQGKVKRVYVDHAPRVQRISNADMNFKEEINKEFDLAADSLIRVVLSPAQMVVTISHIICDLTTLQVLLAEVRTVYLDGCGGLSKAPSPKPYDYRDPWDKAIIPEDIEFWRRNLTDLPKSLLGSRKRKGYRNGKSLVWKLPTTVAEKFDAICRSGKGYTSHQVAMAAVALALQEQEQKQKREMLLGEAQLAPVSTEEPRDSEGIDIVLGGPYLGRGVLDQETVGLFLEPIPFRIRSNFNPLRCLDGDKNASGNTNGDVGETFLDAIRDASRESLSHAIPWTRLLDTLDSTPSPSVSSSDAEKARTPTIGEWDVRSNDWENGANAKLPSSSYWDFLDVMVTHHPAPQHSSTHTRATGNTSSSSYSSRTETARPPPSQPRQQPGPSLLPVPEGVTPLVTWTEGAKFKLMCEFTALRQGGVILRMEWDTDALDEEDVEEIREGIWKGVARLAGGDDATAADVGNATNGNGGKGEQEGNRKRDGFFGRRVDEI
ncbi:Condensation domain protein [Zalerion maritima]|uniref:Condensation domain protein n=1 Tax=Zalerion maritima TaxID=339359 RepID=A0AAD5WV36_9PEZI|nr:Condensation domain protein [Zalerion maritima]